MIKKKNTMNKKNQMNMQLILTDKIAKMQGLPTFFITGVLLWCN